MMSFFSHLSFVPKIIIIFLPWSLKRCLLSSIFGYKLDPTASIGLAWIFPRKLVMCPYSSIASFTVAVNLDLVHLDSNSRIGRSNWITGFPTGTKSPHFSHQIHRRAELHLGKHSAISKCHHIDCTNCVTIGDFSTIAGYRSQILTHSVDILSNRQDSSSISIGSYVFVGTNCILLGGSCLPSYSVLGALSLLNKSYSEEYSLFAGNPAKKVKSLDADCMYFNRATGFVY